MARLIRNVSAVFFLLAVAWSLQSTVRADQCVDGNAVIDSLSFSGSGDWADCHLDVYSSATLENDGVPMCEAECTILCGKHWGTDKDVNDGCAVSGGHYTGSLTCNCNGLPLPPQ